MDSRVHHGERAVPTVYKALFVWSRLSRETLEIAAEIARLSEQPLTWWALVKLDW
jgi:hypothetical protein